MGCDVARGRVFLLLSSKILPKIVAAHPYCSFVTAAAQLEAAKGKMGT